MHHSKTKLHRKGDKNHHFEFSENHLNKNEPQFRRSVSLKNSLKSIHIPAINMNKKSISNKGEKQGLFKQDSSRGMNNKFSKSLNGNLLKQNDSNEKSKVTRVEL